MEVSDARFDRRESAWVMLGEGCGSSGGGEEECCFLSPGQAKDFSVDDDT